MIIFQFLELSSTNELAALAGQHRPARGVLSLREILTQESHSGIPALLLTARQLLPPPAGEEGKLPECSW